MHITYPVVVTVVAQFPVGDVNTQWGMKCISWFSTVGEGVCILRVERMVSAAGCGCGGVCPILALVCSHG